MDTQREAASRFVVRYSRSRQIGDFSAPIGLELARGDQVAIRTDRGIELGEVLCPSTERCSALLSNGSHGAVLRKANEEDLATAHAIVEKQQAGYRACVELIQQRRLQMKLVDVEAILGGERLVFYYLAEHRVDFRELVKDLARLFRTRIEMRQIGVRDEAKLLADYGDCGKPVCCNTHLTHMPPVAMRMAKLQKSTLDPAKISGRCGRLKCCLRYEFDTYQELERELPAIGSIVETPIGTGRVEAIEILAQRALVEFEDRRRILVDAGAIRVVGPARGPKSA